MIRQRIATLAFALLVLFAAQVSRAGELTVMSYNVENMFDVFDDPYSNDESTDVKRRDEIESIARAIAFADADVVVFQELENEHLLQGMVDTFLVDSGYTYVACQRTNDARGINLGVISRYPITSLSSYRFRTLTHPDVPGQTWRFARDVMQINLDIDGTPLHVLDIHLKSNSSSPGDPNSMHRRSAEVLGLRQIIRENYALYGNDALILAMGDFNSNIETRPEQNRPWPATQLMQAPEPDGTMLMHDAFHGQAYNNRVTIMGDDRYPPAVFDYIYASPALHAGLVADSMHVIRDEAMTSGSDHCPVFATYMIE